MDRETVRLIVYQMVKALDHMHSLNVTQKYINHLVRLFTETLSPRICYFKKFNRKLALDNVEEAQ